MNPRHQLLLIVATSLMGCAGPGAPRAGAPLPTPDLVYIRPAVCPFGIKDKPEYDVEALACYVKFMKGTQDYLSHGGRPIEHTDQHLFEDQRRMARERIAVLSTWLDQAAFEPKAAPIKAEATAPSVLAESSRQHHLLGIIAFQKENFAKARQEWMLAKQLDPSNKDVLESLMLLKKYMPD